MAGLPERIRTAAERLGSNRRLAELAGMPETTLYRYMSGEHVPNAEALVRVANAAGVNLQWLATGNGSMLRGAQEVLLKNEQELKDFYLIPRYKVSASAGAGALIESEQIVDALAFKIDWLRRNLNVQARNLVLISAVGDSMAPTIKSGDLLLVNTAETRFRDDAVYVVAIEDSLIVKRLQRQRSGTVVIISDNPAYKAQEVPAVEVGALRIVGRVIWMGSVI